MTEEIKNRIEQIKAGQVPEGYKKTKVGIVPEGWYENVLGEYISEYRELTNDISTYPVYSSSRQGLVPQAEYYDEKEASETNLGYKIVPDGFVTYRHMSDDDIFHFNINRTGKSVLVSSEYPVFSENQNGCLYYLISLLNDMPRFRYFSREEKLGGTRTRLYYKNLCLYAAAFPPLPEQKKIAEILQQCDKVIELKQSKIEELQKLKKACLNKMFPKEGHNVPELRFPGFTEVWEQRKLGEACSNFEYGLNAAATAYDGRNKYIRITDIDDASHRFNLNDLTSPDADLNLADNYKLQENDLLFARTGASVGKTYLYRASDGLVYYAGFLIRAKIKSEYDAEFIFQNTMTDEYNRFIRITSQRSGQPGVNAQEYADYCLLAPPKAEQEKIGIYFRNLDNIITLHQRELEETQKYKKALMRLLLTGIVRVQQ